MTGGRRKVVQQHYVPRFYLKGFATGPGGENQVYAFDKVTGKTFRTSIESIAKERHFYDIDGDQTVERALGILEADFAVALGRLVRNGRLDCLTSDDKLALSMLVATQLLRTAELRTQIKQLAGMLAALPTAIKPSWFPSPTEAVAEESIKKAHMSALLSNLRAVMDALRDELSWHLCMNDTDTPFWTSDNPCAMYNELKPNPGEDNLGLQRKGFHLHFPLTSRLLLVMLNRSTKLSDLKRAKKADAYRGLVEISKSHDCSISDTVPEVIQATPEGVAVENTLQVIWSTRFIISSDDEFDLARTHIARDPACADPGRRRIIVSWPRGSQNV